MPIMSLKAASISRLDVTGPDSASVGDSFSVSFYIDFSGIDKNTLGVGGVVYELAFDDSILSITKAYSSGFDTEVTTQDGRYFVASVINDGNLASKCSDGILHCGNYVATLTFYVKNANASNTGIKIGNGNALLYKVGSNYNESDSNIITSYSETSHLINVINKESVSTTEPKSIATNGSSKSIISKAESKISKASQNDVKTSKKETTTAQNKSNNYLSSLKIKNHAIDFNKDKLEYNIYVKDEENKLTINAKAEDANANIKITGADDLKNSNDLVTVEVTSEDGSGWFEVIVNQQTGERGWVYTNQDDFWTVWNERFQVMRDRSWTRTGRCADCKVYRYCEGNGLHLRDEHTGELLCCHWEQLQ